MGNECCRIIGLLGVPNSGKTACLVSLYLLLSHDQMSEYSFADSRSLLALDELARGARRWQSDIPKQMTARTERDDDRFPGFMHLKLHKKGSNGQINLLVPDLPGEWTDSLVDQNRADRLSFIRGADHIWVMVNGKELIAKKHRLTTIHRTCLIIGRIAELCNPNIPPIRLVVSHADYGKPDIRRLGELKEYASRRGITLPVNSIASFSKSEDVKPGLGIAELLADTMQVVSPEVEFWPEAVGGLPGMRNALRIGSPGVFV
ncbi:MAG: hypothetical protein OXD44_00465 [Gammaproteobacteria bacterium]|nr:hypothetical protein [Gammaproteobacteria bacterium]